MWLLAFFVWIGFCTRWCRLSLYPHNLHLNSRGSLFSWTSWNMFFCQPDWKHVGQGSWNPLIQLLRLWWWGFGLSHNVIPRGVKTNNKTWTWKIKFLALLNFNVNFRAIPTSRRSTPTWRNYGSSYLKWSRAWEQGWYIVSSCAVKDVSRFVVSYFTMVKGVI